MPFGALPLQRCFLVDVGRQASPASRLRHLVDVLLCGLDALEVADLAPVALQHVIKARGPRMSGVATPTQLRAAVGIVVRETLPAVLRCSGACVVKRVLGAIMATPRAPLPKPQSMHEHGKPVSRRTFKLIGHMTPRIAGRQADPTPRSCEGSHPCQELTPMLDCCDAIPLWRCCQQLLQPLARGRGRFRKPGCHRLGADLLEANTTNLLVECAQFEQQVRQRFFRHLKPGRASSELRGSVPASPHPA